MDERTYSTDELAAMCPGLTFRMLDHWERTKLIEALPRAKHSHGYPRRFTQQEAQVAVGMFGLRSLGFQLKEASQLARAMELGDDGRLLYRGDTMTVSVSFRRDHDGTGQQEAGSGPAHEGDAADAGIASG